MEKLNNCIFCKIANNEIKANIVGENDNAIAFLDLDPKSDGHTLVIPKQHYQDLASTPQHILNDVMALVKTVEEKLNNILKPYGFNYVSNQGTVAGQIVMHFHVHVIPKYGTNEGYKSEVINKFVRPVSEVYEEIIKNTK